MKKESVRLEDIREMVAKSLKSDFQNVKVISVEVDRDIDFDGDEVLNISVVFEGTPKDIDARMISGAVRHVRPHLEKIGEFAFPLMSFVSGKDAGIGSKGIGKVALGSP